MSNFHASHLLSLKKTELYPLIPAFAITMSIRPGFVANIAVLNIASWSSHCVVSHLMNLHDLRLSIVAQVK